LTTQKNHNYLAGKNTLVFIHNTVFHAFLGEAVSDPESVKSLIKIVFEKFRLPYFTLTPTFSVCPIHGYIAGEHFTCPKCTIEYALYSNGIKENKKNLENVPLLKYKLCCLAAYKEQP